ncbi:MAG: hypothetical protein V7767_03460 [Leeuwenhoekiella sp.]
MSDFKEFENLYSVRFRNKGYKRKRLLAPDREFEFLNFLMRALGENVFVISTGLGMDVYYTSSHDQSVFIEKNLWIFRPETEESDAIALAEVHSGNDVILYFNTVVQSLSGHPQLFLSCCKKLISKFNTTGVETPLNKLLYNCFDEQLNRLSIKDNVPFALKIAQIRSKNEHPFLKSYNTVRHLAEEYLAADHIN